jgi:ABC-2 type transport system permease protein
VAVLPDAGFAATAPGRQPAARADATATLTEVFVNSARTQFRLSVRSAFSVGLMLSTIPQAVVIGWIAEQSPQQSQIEYVAFGALLNAAWTAGLLRIGWSLVDDMRNGVLQHALLSRSPLVVAMAGRASAIVSLAAVAGVVPFLVVWLVSGVDPPFDRLWLVVPALVGSLVSIMIVALTLMPLLALEQDKAGFVNALVPVGSILSGFLFPLSAMPGAVEFLARVLPTSWTSELVQLASDGGSIGEAAARIAVALLVSLAWCALAVRLFLIVERRMRVNGSLQP